MLLGSGLTTTEATPCDCCALPASTHKSTQRHRVQHRQPLPIASASASSASPMYWAAATLFAPWPSILPTCCSSTRTDRTAAWSQGGSVTLRPSSACGAGASEQADACVLAQHRRCWLGRRRDRRNRCRLGSTTGFESAIEVWEAFLPHFFPHFDGLKWPPAPRYGLRGDRATCRRY